MKSLSLTDIVWIRLERQRLLGPQFASPHQVVDHLGAVQAQDFNAAKWSLATRIEAATDASIERAYSDGAILRTHVMRPTWHFVTPESIRGLLQLTSPRVHASANHRYRKLELDSTVFRRAIRIMRKALEGGRYLTRAELRNVFERKGLDPGDNLRMTHLVFYAELEGEICSGPRREKQFTYALLEERVPKTAVLSRDEVLHNLTLKYFTGHGPATAKDFAWWSGLATVDVKRGIDMVHPQLCKLAVEGVDYWLSPPVEKLRPRRNVVNLLGAYDEYLVGYSTRGAAIDSSLRGFNPNPIGDWNFLVNGKVVGEWERVLDRKKAHIYIRPLRALSRPELKSAEKAATRYFEFLGLKGNVSFI